MRHSCHVARAQYKVSEAGVLNGFMYFKHGFTRVLLSLSGFACASGLSFRSVGLREFGWLVNNLS